ncbi:MAG: 16S rRNA (cytosine(1402)-N(4))-methyltransferase [Candidatus Nealsonbacteria bacterium CG_4_9_14_3_um_filter_35_11]|uniref:Ribosomal RNA small subunit methyltransferase H n=1 Tax=Candidatus Nealsonbacteria bacterium CG11_big_fil_rev_8_21_14_0_20_35_11 TaxID=1974713 RepID=A0A2H0N2A5_9BACT|nr:MAG: 16S rRNA (cytosine(1402)-N(4))-methyltransferase [Candidatus Nealsonbacteria bacterium CG11_big_fil_rev_8_21_14_0_20_35_11]PJA84711.1 MAG: 16S rRNA (cytosine(1402)-N(4))-methyltransferase [Candidatus Nealsonbacteria bacterium CG_4_9_14_3_um_filter_35_11]
MHIPVLQEEVLEYLNPKPNENFIDCTIGEAGHSLAIIERILPNGLLLGIDWSHELIQKLKIKYQISNIKNNLILVCDNFANLKEIVKKYVFKQVHGILFDLGLSSWHLEESGKGFSFKKDEPLIMSYSPAPELIAKQIVNQWPGKDIERILKEYSEEKFAKRIAEEIVKARRIKPIQSTFQLVEIIKKAVPSWYQHRKIHFATKTFQALRIAVNDELNNIEKALLQALEALKPNGRLVIISFHSLEDRIIKNFFQNQAKNGLLKILTKNPLKPSLQEIKINPRSRSAKLRAAQKV